MSQERLNGIDLCRGLAAFAVILVHSGDETWGLPITDGAIHFRYLFFFAVPFFLAVSFYFGTRKLPVKLDRRFWSKKFQRIVLPYTLWSLFYVVTKTSIYDLSDRADNPWQLFADPIALIFLGAAAYHLYFLPLLVVGFFLLYLANYLSQQNNWFSVSLIICSLISYQLLTIYQNNFDLGNYTAFPELLRLVATDNIFYQPWRIALVYSAWLLRCLPYFTIALALNRLLNDSKNINRCLYRRSTSAVLIVVCIWANTFAQQYLPRAFSEMIIAYSLLLFAISVSKHIPKYKAIANLGACSFGIYLIHPLVKSVVEVFLVKLVPQITQSISISSISVYSLTSFFASWLVVILMQRNKLIARYI